MTPDTHNYRPSPIELLTNHSVEQKTLAALLRIEALLERLVRSKSSDDEAARIANPKGRRSTK